jgi:hypothetical protein
MTDIHTEQVKLRAAYYNGVAIALVAVGGFALAFSFLQEASSLKGVFVAFAVFVGLAVCSVALREIAVISLRDIGIGN